MKILSNRGACCLQFATFQAMIKLFAPAAGNAFYAFLLTRGQVRFGYDTAAVCAIVGCTVMCTMPRVDDIERKAALHMAAGESGAGAMAGSASAHLPADTEKLAAAARVEARAGGGQFVEAAVDTSGSAGREQLRQPLLLQ